MNYLISLFYWIKYFIICFLIVGINISPVSALTDCYKAKQLIMKGNFSSEKEKAIQYYLQSIKLCPGDIQAYEYLGNLYRKQKQNKKAIEYFIKAANLGSNNYKLYYLLSSLLFQQGDLNESHKFIKKSLKIKDNYPKSVALNVKIEEKIDSDGPKIVIFEPSTPRGIIIRYANESITVRGIATDKSGVAWVRVNNFNTTMDLSGRFLKDIPLNIGINTITIEAKDLLGNHTSLSMALKREKPVRQIAKEANFIHMGDIYDKSHAVVIGINKYEKWSQLEFAVTDAMAVKDSFKKAGFDDITAILDEKATRSRILTILGHDLPQKTGRNDIVIIYFAGHGQTEDLSHGGKMGYIIPVDADTSNYFTNSISMEQIRSLSSRIPAKHIFYVMDSCYSGLGLNRSSGVSPAISGYLRKVSSMRAVQVITAGGKGEQVQEKAGHGLFTKYFLKALEGEADFNNDGIVTGTELGAYLRPQVSYASQQKQTPLFGRLEGEGEVLFFIKKKK